MNGYCQMYNRLLPHGRLHRCGEEKGGVKERMQRRRLATAKCTANLPVPSNCSVSGAPNKMISMHQLNEASTANVHPQKMACINVCVVPPPRLLLVVLVIFHPAAMAAISTAAATAT